MNDPVAAAAPEPPRLVAGDDALLGAAAPLPAAIQPATSRPRGGWLPFALVLLGGLIARAALVPAPGHVDDPLTFAQWTREITHTGLRGFYPSGTLCNYPPFFVLVMRGIGYLASLRDPGLVSDALLRMALKVPACLADLLAAILLYREGRRLSGSRFGLSAAALYFLNPLAIYNSAYWGQVDGIHSALLIAALLATNRMRPLRTGLWLGLALLAKLQSIAFAPLFIFDIYRWRRFRGLLALTVGGILAAGLVLAPFLFTRSARDALTHGYGVVGQYPRLSINAFNPWYALGDPDQPDDATPPFIVRLVAGRADEIADDASWLLHITWRQFAMAGYVAVVALALSLYAGRRSASARSLCAGALGLAFFVMLTEMHERYLHPAFAVLAVWAAGSLWKERAYVLLSIAALLNLTVALDVGQIGPQIGALLGLSLIAMLVGLLLPERGAAPVAAPVIGAADLAAPPHSRLVRYFRAATALLFTVLVAAGGLGVHRWQSIRPGRSLETGVCYLSDLRPEQSTQGTGVLHRDSSLSGAVIHLGNRYYARGLGTHAPCTVVYKLPEGYAEFDALVGINRAFQGKASFQVWIDDRQIYKSAELTADSAPEHVRIPIAGVKRLKLIGRSGDSKSGDHIDWALARLIKHPPSE